MTNILSKKTGQSAWVVFSEHTDLGWLKFLKFGFRHCFVLLNDGRSWVSVDPLSAYTNIEIHYHIEASFDLPAWLEGQGYKVTSTAINQNHKKPAPWMFLTCVESVKRILGIHKRFIFTPWQLYQFLGKTTEEQEQNLKGKLSWPV